MARLIVTRTAGAEAASSVVTESPNGPLQRYNHVVIFRIGPRRVAMKYKLLLWDFDGTLADTLTLALGIYNRMAAKRDFLPIDDPEAVRHMGMREFLKAHKIPAHYIPLAFSQFLGQLRRLATDIRLNDGVKDTVSTLLELQVEQGVVSSNDTSIIQTCLEANQIAHAFRYISGTSRIFGKERRIRKAIRQCEHIAQEVLYIGDEVRDIEAARAAGLDIASVTWGLNNKDALQSCGPTYLIDHPDEITAILRS